MKKIIFLVLLLLDASLSYSQNNPDSVEVPAAVKVIARPLPDSILLRWAPNNPITWQFANKYGYRIEKYLLLQNNQLLAGPQSVSVHTIKSY